MPPAGDVVAAGAAFTVTAGRRMIVVLLPASASWTVTAATEAPSPAEASNAATAMGVLMLICTFRRSGRADGPEPRLCGEYRHYAGALCRKPETDLKIG